jgi:hypothetical protein
MDHRRTALIPGWKPTPIVGIAFLAPDRDLKLRFFIQPLGHE